MSTEAKAAGGDTQEPIVIEVETRHRPESDQMIEIPLKIVEHPRAERATYTVRMVDRFGNAINPVAPPTSAAGGSQPDTADTSPDGNISLPLEEQITGIEQRLESLKDSAPGEMINDLRSWAKQAGESATIALSAAHQAIVYAWATGRIFNLAKGKMGHGRFGPWRNTMAAKAGISKRTVQYWMKLADQCSDVRAFLVPGASLTGVYRAVGILPEPDPVTKGGNDDDDDGDDPSPPATPSRVEPTFAALAEGRMRLRHLDESGEILGDEDRDRLEAEKSAYLTLFDKLLNPIIP